MEAFTTNAVHLEYGVDYVVSADGTTIEPPPARTCRNCRFWSKYRGEAYGACQNETVLEQVIVYEGEGFHQDFGCIHFEVKDGNDQNL